ncbi:hypothetical protein O6H91_04G079000 [Diphasiastrum complanatum]|uniref:Uncharacterized protein n=1 Tax=Diphasiastrum complanatum TaxID=34168 RepID=A0ACC2DYK7_DIPCM|nr:hypothetical protein O6H91_04G079000 [Diphasiastrum complanatum]
MAMGRHARMARACLARLPNSSSRPHSTPSKQNPRRLGLCLYPYGVSRRGQTVSMPVIGVRSFSSGELPPHQVLPMPALSPTMNQGNVLNWKKKEGDEISAGDVLCEIETDKATLDFESVEDGFLAKIMIPAGSKDVPVGKPLAIVVERAEDVSKFAGSDIIDQSPKKDPEQAESKNKTDQSKVPEPSAVVHRDRIGPSVRRLLAESGIDASSINPTGPHGILVKADVLAAVKSGVKSVSVSKAEKPIPSPPASKPISTTLPTAPTAATYDDVPTTQIRKVIAKRLLESKYGIPHFYINADAMVDEILKLRKVLKAKHGLSVSVNDFIIKAAALALKAVPEANAYWDEKAGDIVLHQSVDVSVAVATDKGLMTPILKDANLKSLASISSEVKVLAEKARSGKLKPQEFQGGSFSISNLGMYSVDRFSAIINPPQAGILAVGKGEKTVVWHESAEGQGSPRTVTKICATLSADNRVFDSGIGARFLSAFSANLEDPTRMLL